MASSKVMAILVVLVVFVPSSAIFDDLAPALAPFYDELCHKMKCGKGTCKAKKSFTFSYDCECDAGWKRSPIDKVNNYLKFLPCVYPECTFNFSSGNLSQPRLPVIPHPFNLTNFDPCSVITCGAGACKNISSYEYICKCNSGYKNLFNVSNFPCYNKDSLGVDCAALGLEVSNAEVDTNGANQATSSLPGKVHWMTIFIMSAAMNLWK